MAKESGIAATVSVDDSGGVARDISNDITNFTFETPRPQMDVTGLDKTAVERLLLLADFSADLNGVFNDAANLSHAVMATIPSSSVARTVTIVISGQTLAVEAYGTNYALARAITGELTWNAPFILQDGSVPTWA